MREGWKRDAHAPRTPAQHVLHARVLPLGETKRVAMYTRRPRGFFGSNGVGQPWRKYRTLICGTNFSYLRTHSPNRYFRSQNEVQ